MKTSRMTLVVSILTLSVAGVAQAQQAPPEKTFDGANHLRIHVREVVPGGQPSSVQVSCYLKHQAAGDTTLAAVADLDKELGGVIKKLRDSDQFEGFPLETLYFRAPQGSIKAKGMLLVGVGDEQELSLETMKHVGTVALRDAILLNATTVSFAAGLQDQNVKKLDVGDVAGAVVGAAILCYDTEKKLQERGLRPQHSISDWYYEAGPDFFKRTVEGVDEAVKKANAQVAERASLE